MFMTFKEFFCERVYRLSNIEQETVNQVADSYMNIFNPKNLNHSWAKIIAIGPEKVYNKFLNNKRFITIGFVKFHDDRLDEDREIPVYVGFDKNSNDKGTYIYQTDEEGNKKEEYILLHYYKIKYDRDFIEDAVVHELFHAKQQYKTPGEHYHHSKLDYYTDPVEAPAYVSNVIKAIENEYLERDREGQNDLLKFIEAFIREGKLPNLPESSLIKKIGKDEFVQYLYDNRDNPKYKGEYRKLINKLNWLYTQLKEYQNR